jgi:predicted regulator of amino acid metabolism with ACT domain
MMYLKLYCTKIYIMYPILESAFSCFPMRKRVAETFLIYGLSVDTEGTIFCGKIEMSPAKIARALNLDRRVVLETARMISAIPELQGIFGHLEPTAFIGKAAKHLGFEVLIIEAEPHAIGIIGKTTKIIADAKIVIRQIVADDPDIYPKPKLTIVLEKPLPSNALSKLRKMKEISRLSIE